MITEEGKVKDVLTTGRAIHQEQIADVAVKRGFTKILRTRTRTHEDCGQKFLYEHHSSVRSMYYGSAYQCNHGLDYSINRVGDLFLNACQLAIEADNNHGIYVKVYVRFDAANCNPKHTTIEKAQADHDKAIAALRAKQELFDCIKPSNLHFRLFIQS
jgi:hypothetical protein